MRFSGISAAVLRIMLQKDVRSETARRQGDAPRRRPASLDATAAAFEGRETTATVTSDKIALRR